MAAAFTRTATESLGRPNDYSSGPTLTSQQCFFGGESPTEFNQINTQKLKSGHFHLGFSGFPCYGCSGLTVERLCLRQ